MTIEGDNSKGISSRIIRHRYHKDQIYEIKKKINNHKWVMNTMYHHMPDLWLFWGIQGYWMGGMTKTDPKNESSSWRTP